MEKEYNWPKELRESRKMLQSFNKIERITLLFHIERLLILPEQLSVVIQSEPLINAKDRQQQKFEKRLREKQMLPITWGRMKLSRWPFYSCSIFQAYVINLNFFFFHISLPSSRLGYISYKKGNHDGESNQKTYHFPNALNCVIFLGK